GPTAERARERLCRLLAREAAFGETTLHSEAVPLSWLRECAPAPPAEPQPEEVVEALVSSGVLQWSMGRRAVRFFHQTFFEYAAAYDLLCRILEGGGGDVAALLDDAAAGRFFRVPILKQ